MENEKEILTPEEEITSAAQTEDMPSANETDDVSSAPVSADEPEAVQNTESDAASANEPSEDADDESKPHTPKERIAFPLYDLASIIGTAVIAIMVVFTFFYRFVGVQGPSMQPTLFENDWLAVSAIPHEPKSGDVVIITQPNAFDEPIVKRVVATGGQTVDIRDGHVYIDGEMLTETYIASDVYTEREDLDNYPLTIPKGYVFVLGDNRTHSTDSRSGAVGIIENNYVLGTVSFRMFPFGKWKVNIDYSEQYS